MKGVKYPCSDPNNEEKIYAIVQSFNTYLSPGPLEHKMRRIKEHESGTYFAWIGKFGLGDPYYFRIHSPVTSCEVSRQSFIEFICGADRDTFSLTSIVVVSILYLPQPLSHMLIQYPFAQSSSPIHPLPKPIYILSTGCPTARTIAGH